MGTLMTEITVSGNKVFTTYSRNSQSYDGFDVFETREEAISHSEKLMSYNVFDNDFFTNSKTKYIIK